MHRKVLSTLLLGTLAACGGETIQNTMLSQRDLTGGPFDDGTSSQVDRQSAEDRVTALLGGRVVSSKLDIERGLSVIEVYVQLDSGALIEVSIEESTGRVVQIEGKRGPFTDDIDPGSNFVSLQQAIASAQAAKSGAVVGWELELEDGIWVYQVELEGDVHVDIDAESGALLRDDHGADPWDDTHEDDGVHADAPASFTAAALAMVQGEVTKSERELELGMPVWKLTVTTSGGAAVEIYLLVDSGALYRARGDSGAFDYNVDPGRGWLSLDDAIRISAAERNSIEKWRLDRNDRGDLAYEIRYLRGDRDTTVFIDATTGAAEEK